VATRRVRGASAVEIATRCFLMLLRAMMGQEFMALSPDWEPGRRGSMSEDALADYSPVFFERQGAACDHRAVLCEKSELLGESRAARRSFLARGLDMKQVISLLFLAVVSSFAADRPS